RRMVSLLSQPRWSRRPTSPFATADPRTHRARWLDGMGKQYLPDAGYGQPRHEFGKRIDRRTAVATMPGRAARLRRLAKHRSHRVPAQALAPAPLSSAQAKGVALRKMLGRHEWG